MNLPSALPGGSREGRERPRARQGISCVAMVQTKTDLVLDHKGCTVAVGRAARAGR